MRMQQSAVSCHSAPVLSAKKAFTPPAKIGAMNSIATKTKQPAPMPEQSFFKAPPHRVAKHAITCYTMAMSK